MVIDHQVGLELGRQLVVAGARLGVHQGETLVALEAQVADVADLEVQAAHHLAVLGAADDAAVGGGGALLERAAQQVAEQDGRGEGVGIGVVVRQDEPALALASFPPEALRQHGEPLAGGLRDHRWILAHGPDRAGKYGTSS